MISGLIFFMFALVLIASAVLVVTVRQPVAAVLFLILAFFNAAGLFVLLQAEFLAFILMIVYVGAVAVLFLFVVMMLDVRKEAQDNGTGRRNLPIGLGVGSVLLAQLMIAIWSWPKAAALPDQTDGAVHVENSRALGRILYTDFAYPFQVSGIVLLVAMIGAIVLTFRQRDGAKKQKLWTQLDRRKDDVLEIRKVKSGEGIL